MIVSVGTDLARIDRVEEVAARRGARFLERVFTAAERAYCERRAHPATHFASRFAAKEAAMKALGTGWSSGVRWVDLEVVRAPGEAPRLVLHGRSAELARERGIDRLHLSLTHDGGLALAVVVAERLDGRAGGSTGGARA